MEIPSSVKTIIRSTAPTLFAAIALPPPFNLIAAAVVSGALKAYLPESPMTPPAANTLTPPQPAPVATPEQIVQAVEQNNANPQLVLDLRKAEADLKKYETDSGIRFAEIELEDKKNARAFQTESGISEKVFTSGMTLVVIALISLLFVVMGSLSMIFLGDKIPDKSQNIVVAVFGIIGTIVGFVNGIAANVVSFYWGSSQGSKEKSDRIADVMQNLGTELGKAASNQPSATQAVRPPRSDAFMAAVDQQEFNAPASPVPSNLISEVLPELTSNHPFSREGVSWKLAADGIWIDNVKPNGTMGEPTTIKSIWSRYGDLCIRFAKQYGVPVELIIATIAVESSGNPNARRAEPQIGDESVGLMQTLVRTARGALGQKDIVGDSLLRPELSIEAGTAYIASQRGATHFDPPKVAAAYNAGSIRLDSGEKNKWKMLCYPTGTGNHIDKFVEYFNDCMAVGSTLDMGAKGTPSFSARLKPAH